MRMCSRKWTLCHLSSYQHLMRSISDSRTPIYKWMQVICFYWLRLEHGEKNMQFALFRSISLFLSVGLSPFAQVVWFLIIISVIIVFIVPSTECLKVKVAGFISQKTTTFALLSYEWGGCRHLLALLLSHGGCVALAHSVYGTHTYR